LQALSALPLSQLVVASAFYRNPPLGDVPQPDFVNAVAGLVTRLPPRELLRALKAIEREQGRERRPGDRWGPRVLDLDLLVFGDQRIDEGHLVVPHPGIADRNFVLFPLLEIAPWLVIPGLGEIRALAARLDARTLVRLD
jgi:2-amino-4-hydroxy-6-hydroxymethyldihydropteridine diphosphokinase